MSNKDTEDLAARIVNKVVADLFYDQPKLRAATSKISLTDWQAAMDAAAEEVYEILANTYGINS